MGVVTDDDVEDAQEVIGCIVQECRGGNFSRLTGVLAVCMKLYASEVVVGNVDDGDDRDGTGAADGG